MNRILLLLLCALFTSTAYSQTVNCGTPLNTIHCYDDFDATTWLFTASDGTSPLKMTFNAGEIEDCCDDIIIYDGTDNTAPILYLDNNGGDLAGLEIIASGPNIFMEIDSDGSVSCIDDDGIPYIQWDWDVECLSCTPAAGSVAQGSCTPIVGYMLDVNVSSIGDGTVIIANDGGVGSTTVMATGTYPVGPFSFNSTVTITLAHPTDSSCDVALPAITLGSDCPPGNDECSGALALFVNDDLACGLTFPGSIANSTGSPEDPTACFGTEDDDVWYTFTATGSTHTIDLINLVNGTTDLYHSVWEGTCGSLTLFPGSCSDPNSSTVSGLTMGETYYLRIYSWTDTPGQTTVFEVCIGTPPAPPAEDNCIGAITIPVTADMCTGLTTGNNTSATDSNNDTPQPPAASCTAYNGGDIWFRLTVPASGNVTISGGPSPGCCSFLWYEVYTGSSCSSLTSFMCSSTSGNDPSAFEMILTGQTPGATLWIRAWDSNNDNGPGEFNFCAKEVAPPPNDECATPEMIVESTDANCNNAESSTTLNATTSANNDCSFSPDVWFELEAISNSITVDVSNLVAAGPSGLTPVSAVIMVYESCSGANIACAFSPATFAATPGNTYYIAVSTRDINNTTAPATFDICAYPTPLPPGNDECSDAITVMQSVSTACENEVPGTTYFSTFSSENICAGGGNDVWYSFVATSETMGVSVDNLQPTPAGGVPTNAVVGVFSGLCGTFTQLACVFDQVEVAVNLGETYYVSVTCRDAGNFPVFSDFDICVYALPPANDNCVDASILAMNTTGSLINQYFGGATPSGLGPEGCDAAGVPTPADVWYSINTDADGGNLIVIVEPGPQSDVVVAIYDACGSPIPEQCVDLSGNGGAETINFNANFKDDKGDESSSRDADYFVRVYEKIPSGQPFEIGAQGEALPIVLGSFEAKAEERGNKVQWSTLSEINSDYIEVLSSPNGSTRWEAIGKVQTKGESNSRLEYELFDYNPYAVTYYRLNAVDKDGKAELSNVINVKRSDTLGKMVLSPNPASSLVTVQTSSEREEIAKITLIDMTGKVVKQEKASLIKGLNTINLDLNDMQAGLYLFSLQTEDGVQVEKFVKH